MANRPGTGSSGYPHVGSLGGSMRVGALGTTIGSALGATVGLRGALQSDEFKQLNELRQLEGVQMSRLSLWSSARKQKAKRHFESGGLGRRKGSTTIRIPLAATFFKASPPRSKHAGLRLLENVYG